MNGALITLSAQLSIVMPVYNEMEGIEGVVDELRREIADRLEDVELVVVNDASTDDSGAILDRLAAADHRLKVHHAERNAGHGPALRRALDASSGHWILQLDSDGQQVAADFWTLWQRRDGADLMMGQRPIRRNGYHRVVVSAGARYVNRAFGGGNIRDANVPFKLFRRSLWEDLRDDIPTNPLVPSLLIALGAAVRGWRIDQVAITSRPRRHGPSSLGLRALVRLSTGAIRELLTFRARLTRRGA